MAYNNSLTILSSGLSYSEKYTFPLEYNTLVNAIIIDSINEKDINLEELNQKYQKLGHAIFTHNFCIKENGSIYLCRDIEYSSYIEPRIYSNVIGIMLEGNFNTNTMNILQLKSLVNLVLSLVNVYPYIKDNVYLHSEINGEYKNSPGPLFPYVKFKNLLLGNESTYLSIISSKLGVIIYELGSRNLEYKYPTMKGNDVLILKTYLTILGYKFENMDDTYDEECKTIVKSFQSDNNLTINGIMKEEDYTKLNKLIKIKNYENSNDTSFKRVLKLTSPKMTGADVKYMKTLLYNLGYLNTDVTNDEYDSDMETAVKSFQSDNNIREDGTIKNLTYKLIENSINYTFRRILYYDELDLLHGSDIEIIQIKLLQKGYDVEVNGYYDKKTMVAVKNFQLNNSYSITGKINQSLFKQILL